MFLKELPAEEADAGGEGEREKEKDQKDTADAKDSVEIAAVEQVDIGRIRLGESREDAAKEAGKAMGREETAEESKEDKSGPAEVRTGERQLLTFRRQFALVLGMEEEKLEVILIE